MKNLCSDPGFFPLTMFAKDLTGLRSWTLTVQAMKMRCYRKILGISYKDHVTNKEVRAKIQQAIGPHDNGKQT